MIGRPSKYREKFCAALIRHMTTGLSFESFSSVAGVHKDTLYAWTREYPDFSDAKKRAEAASLLYWEKLGIDGVKGKIKGFNAAMWIFNMKNRFKWRDRPDEDIEERETFRPLKNVPTEELLQYYKSIVEAKAQTNSQLPASASLKDE